MHQEELKIILFTFKMAFLSTILIIPGGVFISWILAKKSWFGKSVIESFFYLPIVFPPVATGFLLLLLLSQEGFIGKLLARNNIEIIFTWKAIVIAMSITSFPFFVQIMKTGFENTPLKLEMIAKTLGASNLKVFLTITFPLCLRHFLSALLISFVKAIGEFGTTMMIAGNIPEKTSTLSLSIYHHFLIGKDTSAYRLLLWAFILGFICTLIQRWLLKKNYDYH